MTIYAAMIWRTWRTRTRHAGYVPRLYNTVSPAKGYVTRRNTDWRDAHGERPNPHPPYVIEGDTDDMVRIDLDARDRFGYFETRMLVRATEAQQAELAPPLKKQRRQTAR